MNKKYSILLAGCFSERLFSVFLKLNPSHIFMFVLGAVCSTLIIFFTNKVMTAQHTERLPSIFVPGTRIVETKLSENTYLYQPPYSAKNDITIPAAPLVDRMGERTREHHDHAFVMLAINTSMLCQNLSAEHSDVAILMRPLSADATEIVEVPDVQPSY